MTVREIPWGGEEYASAVALRNMLLCMPVRAGASVFNFDLRTEKTQRHVCAWDDSGSMVGTLVLAPESAEQAHVRQVATRPEVRGRGYGRALMLYGEELARGAGYKRLVLDARQNVIAFYESLGYTVCGETFGDPDLPLTPMEKIL